MKLRLYRVVRYALTPELVMVFAKGRKCAKEIVNKKYGYDWCQVFNVRIKEGTTFEEINRR